MTHPKPRRALEHAAIPFRRVLATVSICALLLAAPAAFAWSALGHRIIGELAQRHLTPAARAQVADLLAGEPDPTLAGVATWADDMRQNDPERFKATKAWHYIDYGGDCHYMPIRDCKDGNCVIAAITQQREILSDRSKPLDQRREALKFLVHFIGDIHQPLHASDRDDQGGNAYQISLRTDLQPEAYARTNYVDGVMGTNLHSVWDFYILGSQGLSTQQYADRLDKLPWPPTPADLTMDPAAWGAESCRAVDSHQLYPPTHKLDQTYLDAQRPFAEQRVRQAAYRLAALLNATLTE